MKEKKMSEPRLSGLNDEQDVGKNKILKSSNHANLDSDNMQQGWEIKKLGEVLVKTEMVDPTKNPDKEFTYLDVSSVNKETKEIEGATVLLGKDAPSRARKLVRENDVIFATVRPTHSRVALITEEYDGQVCSTGYFVLRGKENIDNKYLFYFLLTDEFNKQMEKLQKGASYPAVTDAEVKSIFLRFPKSLSEQQRIVSILDEAFAAIAKAKANAEQNLKNAKELFESYLQGVFEKKGNGWEEKKLGEVYDVRDGTHDSPKYHNQGYPLVTSKNLKNHKLTFDDIKFISETDYLNINKRSKVDVGDVLFAMIGTIGNPVVIEDEPNYAIKNVALFKVGNNQNSYFLKYFLDSKQTIEKMMRDAKGTTQKFVGLGYLRSFPILVPPLKEQQTIVRQLDALRAETQKLEAVYQKKIDDLEELKKSILQKAFAGELKTSQEVV